MLNVVDEEGDIVGVESREKIHTDGLLHREVHVWLYTAAGDVIFQRRSRKKAARPGLLDATVGGHVEIGSDFQSAALQELEEETGLVVRADDLSFLGKKRKTSHDPITKMTNNVIRATYAYRFDGDVADLKIEEGAATGFEVRPLASLMSLSDEERKEFVPFVSEEHGQVTFTMIQGLL